MTMPYKGDVPDIGTVEHPHKRVPPEETLVQGGASLPEAVRISNELFWIGRGRRSGGLLRCGQVSRYIDYGIVRENAPAAFAEHDAVAAPQVLKELRPQPNLTS